MRGGGPATGRRLAAAGGQNPGDGGGGEIERQHHQPRTAGELGRVPRLVREQGFRLDEGVPVRAGEDHIPQAERGCRGQRQPVPVTDQQAITTARQPGPPGGRHQHPGQGGTVDQVGHLPHPVSSTHGRPGWGQDPSGPASRVAGATGCGTQLGLGAGGMLIVTLPCSRCACSALA
jgi:hypothetical protein